MSGSTIDPELCSLMVKGQGWAIAVWQAKEVTETSGQGAGAEHC